MGGTMNGTSETRRSRARVASSVVMLTALTFATTAATAADEPEGWTGEISAALTAQTGTTDSVAANIDAKAERTWEKNFASIRFSGVYGTTRNRGSASAGSDSSQDEETQNSQALFGEWKRQIHDRFFWDTESELSRDNVQNRDVRFAMNTGPGYRFWEGERKAKEHFDVNAGIGYRFELFDQDTTPATDPNPSPDRGRKDRGNFADIVVGFEYKNMLFEDRIEFTHTGSAKMPANNVDAYILTTEVIAGVPLTEAWSLRIGFLAQYQNEQPNDTTNTTTRTTVGLGYKF